jgi:esterase/lipase superfamily enzyme/predicted chitinase
VFITPASLHGLTSAAEDKQLRDQQTRIINTISLNINDELVRAGIAHPKELALFFALVVLDSAQLSNTTDTSDPTSSASVYHSRGLLKIQGVENYRKRGKILGVDLATHPEAVSDPSVALRVATSIWCASYHEKIEFDDLEEIGKEFASRGRPFNSEEFQACLSRAAEVVGFSDPSIPRARRDLSRVRSKSGGTSFTVWYGTNRQPAANGLGFSAERSESIHFGSCTVLVPRAHKIGSIGSSRMKRIFSGEDDRLRVDAVNYLEERSFWESLQTSFKGTNEAKAALVFIHGYNVSFESAAIRAAQIGYDLSAQREMAFFSWPSQGRLGDYLADAATIEVSEAAITEFLIGFVRESGAENVHLIAHSMGNRGLLRALSRIAARTTNHTGKQFGQIILAAADLDVDLFRQNVAAYIDLSQRTSVYVSSKDLAVESSYWLHHFPRVGITPPTIVLDGVDTINVSNLDMSLLGHGYFAEARSVLSDLHDLIVNGSAPEMRFGLRGMTTDGGKKAWQVVS